MKYQGITLSDPTGNLREARQLEEGALPGFNLGRAGAIGEALQWAMGLANQASVIYAINQELNTLEEQIRNGILFYSDNNPDGQCYNPQSCGALIHVILSKPASTPIGQGSGPLSFITLFVAEFGKDASLTLVDYLRQKKLLQGAPDNSEPVWQFIWVTLD